MLESFIREIEEAIASGDTSWRARNLRQLTDLFTGQAGSLNEHHVSIFDEVILRLAEDVEPGARVELSTRLAPVSNAPRKIVKTLASDEHAAVAEPVLEQSPQLSEDDLIELAGLRQQDHLLAISRRNALSERLTDVLVERGDSRVVRAVAENKGAKLSQAGLSHLVRKAQQDTELRSALQKRPDLPGARVPAGAQPFVPKQPAAPARPETAAQIRRLEEVLAKLTKAMVGPGKPSDRDLAPALERLAKTSKGKVIEDVRVANWIKADKIDDTLAAITHNSGLPAAAVAAAYEADGYEPLLAVVRAARLNWNTFKLLFTARDGKALAGDVLKSSFEVFQQVPVPEAQKLGRLLAEPKTAAVGAAA